MQKQNMFESAGICAVFALILLATGYGGHALWLLHQLSVFRVWVLHLLGI